MSDTLIFYEKNNAIISAGFTDGRMDLINIEESDNTYGIGNIYMGRITKIILHMHAAYVDIGISVPCYMELIDGFNYVTDKIHPDGQLHVGDCLPVQIIKEAFRKKPVTVSPELSISNKFFFLKYCGKSGISFSSKIKDGEFKKQMKSQFSSMLTEGINVLFRTNSYSASVEELMQELTYDLSELNRIIETSRSRKKGNLIYSAEPQYIINLRDNAKLECNKVITDSPDIYIKLKDYLEKFQPEMMSRLSFYSDKVLGLDTLYDMKKNLGEIVLERVWLKSGAHIVIEQTEAFVSIDVNTSKASAGKKNFKEGFVKINYEAAEEIFRQIELRDLSGIIIVDFISMKGTEEILFLKRIEELGRNYRNVKVVDMTKLGLVEITRERRHRPIKELITKYKLL